MIDRIATVSIVGTFTCFALSALCLGLSLYTSYIVHAAIVTLVLALVFSVASVVSIILSGVGVGDDH